MSAEPNDIDPAQLKQELEKLQQANQERIDSIDLDKHYKESMTYLDQNFPFFYTDILNLGHPVWDSRITTAAVYIERKEGARFHYIVNPTFAALLEPSELAFIFAHEAMHVVLNHLKLMPGLEAKGMERKKLNIAADVTINNFLRNNGLEPGQLEPYMTWGEDYCHYDTCNTTVKQAYRDIDDQYMQQRQDLSDPLGEFLDAMGESGTGGHEWIYDQKDKAGEAEDIGDGAGNAMKNKRDKEHDKQKSFSAGVGTEAGKLKRFVDTEDVSLRWALLLQKVNPTIFKLHGPAPTPKWHKSPRKLTDLYQLNPNMGALPVREKDQKKKGETPVIVMALDGSGSCAHYIDKFVKLAKSVPLSEITLLAYSFSTYVHDLNLKEKKPELATGGTEFSIIEDKILNDVVPKLSRYPDSVVVMTDGIGRFSSTRPKTHQGKNWLWLIAGNDAYNDRCGTDVPIEEFCEGAKF